MPCGLEPLLDMSPAFDSQMLAHEAFLARSNNVGQDSTALDWYASSLVQRLMRPSILGIEFVNRAVTPESRDGQSESTAAGATRHCILLDC